MAIDNILEFDGKEENKYYKVIDVNKIKNGNGREKNGGTYYLIKLEEVDKKGKNIGSEFEIKIKTMYQFFVDPDEGIFWGFDNFNHRHCYLEECRLKIELLTKAPFKEENLEDALDTYLKKLEVKENIKNLEQWEQEEIKNNKIFREYL